TLFALRSVLSYLFGIGGGIVVRIVLDRVAFPVNYAILYGIGAVVLFLSLLAFSFIREPAPPPEREIPAPTRGWMRERIVRVVGKNRNFRNYIVARAILIISFGTTSFFPVYLVEEFGLPDSVSGVFAIITAATFVLVNPVFGALGNRSGYKVAFLASFVSLAIASVVGLSGVGVPVAHVLIACTAISQSVNFLAYNMTIEFAGETEIPTYIGVCGFFIGLVAPLAIFTGVIVNAFGFDGLFVLTAATAVAGLLVMAFGVEEPRAALRRLNQPDLPY
ncbi:MAG: MFS transporter, partial [Spirochaetota bacterium]